MKYKKNPSSDQFKFDYSVTMVRSKKTAVIENGIANLKGPCPPFYASVFLPWLSFLSVSESSNDGFSFLIIYCSDLRLDEAPSRGRRPVRPEHRSWLPLLHRLRLLPHDEVFFLSL